MNTIDTTERIQAAFRQAGLRAPQQRDLDRAARACGRDATGTHRAAALALNPTASK